MPLPGWISRWLAPTSEGPPNLLPPGEVRPLLSRIRLYRALDCEGKTRFERGFEHHARTLRLEGTRGYAPDRSTRALIAAGFSTVFYSAPPPGPIFSRPIIVYPGRGFSGDFQSGSDDLAGLAVPGGPMVLAARAVREGFAGDCDGYNPVFHEIAHYLDFHAASDDAPEMSLSEALFSPAADGIPAGRSTSDSRRWQRVIGREFERVQNGRSWLAPRIVTDEGELFAVAVEHFFECPEPFRQGSPEWYALMCEYFHLDPASLYQPQPPAGSGPATLP